jgi:hypothetical protein
MRPGNTSRDSMRCARQSHPDSDSLRTPGSHSTLFENPNAQCCIANHNERMIPHRGTTAVLTAYIKRQRRVSVN